MEVFLRGLPERATEAQLTKYFVSTLDCLSIKDFLCQKRRSKPFATITFLHRRDGERFLARFGDAAPSRLDFQGKWIRCSLSKEPPKPFALKSLEYDAKLRRKQLADRNQNSETQISEKNTTIIEVSSLSCGIWTYDGSIPVYMLHVDLEAHGKLKFGPKGTVLWLGEGRRIDIPHSAVQGVTTEGYPKSTIFMTLNEAPNFSQYSEDADMDLKEKIKDLSSLIRVLSLSIEKSQRGPSRTRLTGLTACHKKVAGYCLVYRIGCLNAGLNDIKSAQRQAQWLPAAIQCSVDVRIAQDTFDVEMGRLLLALTSSYAGMPFIVAFQVQKLAQNCYLPPKLVLALLPEISNVVSRSGAHTCVHAIRKLFLQIPFPGPETDAEELRIDTLVASLKKNEQQLSNRGFSAPEGESSVGVAIVHRVMVTPTGEYLCGPEPESSNRVLRKYAGHHNYFIRVQFCDEDGNRVRYSPDVSNSSIFYERFQKVLNDGIHIAGRRFAFLGFSHSSLRAQSCWFVAPFIFNGELLYDRMLIKGLGDFSQIRCPAKCAARIGQAFSDTPTAVTIDPSVVKTLNDVERNGRVFSDGVGTVSMSILQHIWDALPAAKRSYTTLFQIRYSGAKGMIALDSRLHNSSLNLRNSMIKFPGSDSCDIEICGSANRPRPLFLNHQSIKILEDMGVSNEFFLSHQKKEIERLRQVTSSSINASNYVKTHSMGEPVHLPWFIKKLHILGLDFQTDPFLRKIVEMAVLLDLRALKYKARIPVQDGYTLHGIMDESGIVKEGQVFCIVEVDGEARIITGKELIVTRSPALHPGDIQLVTGISVPADSPLMQLRNCICFSQWGQRDLPSQLSGGDLDGDLYHIMFDPDARPKKVFPPAVYPSQPPIDLGRPIEREDMTNFFVKFMDTDQLGRIATLHKVLADQCGDGVMNPDCVKLAELHSTAVDFSKTGIPINVSDIPRGNPFRPDFMAPGPSTIIEKNKPITFDDLFSHMFRGIDEGDDGQPSYRYYESEKILGKLYRKIDERQFFADLQRRGEVELSDPVERSTNRANTMLEKLWAYVLGKCGMVQWTQHLDRAKGIQEEYEYCLLNVAAEYSEHPSRPLTELEVFVGNILGKSGAINKRQHELSISMKQRFNEDLSYIIDCILTDGSDSYVEGLERSIACFQVALERSNDRPQGKKELVSFRYVAAAVCLREVERNLT